MEVKCGKSGLGYVGRDRLGRRGDARHDTGGRSRGKAESGRESVTAMLGMRERDSLWRRRAGSHDQGRKMCGLAVESGREFGDVL